MMTVSFYESDSIPRQPVIIKPSFLRQSLLDDFIQLPDPFTDNHATRLDLVPVFCDRVFRLYPMRITLMQPESVQIPRRLLDPRSPFADHVSDRRQALVRAFHMARKF